MEFGGFPGKRFLPFSSRVLLAPPARVPQHRAPYVTQALATQAKMELEELTIFCVLNANVAGFT